MRAGQVRAAISISAAAIPSRIAPARLAANQKSITVRINDRGPTQAGRILDLSPTAARAIGIHPRGMGEVTAEVVGEAPKLARK